MTSSKLTPRSLPVAALMLSHRNDRRLEKALASVQWAQQILVLDTNPQIATPWSLYTKKFPQLRVLQADSFEVNFSVWRNQLLEYVEQPWVFFIDSDETAVITQPTQFKQLVNSNPASYTVRRIDYFYGQALYHGEVATVWLNRLGPRQDMQFKRVVHETTSQKAPPINSIVLHHESHQSISGFVEKISTYAYLEGKTRVTHPNLIQLYLQIVFYPLAKFFVNYVAKLGFLDGWRGLIYATMMSLHSVMVRIFWYEAAHPNQN